MSTSEPRNPLYLLLLLASVLFVLTVLAYAFVPFLEEKAAAAGQTPPLLPFRDAVRADGGRWLLYEVGLMIVLGIASMVVDRLRALQKEKGPGTIPPSRETPANLPADAIREAPTGWRFPPGAEGEKRSPDSR
jgi:hypothetical protein